MRLISIYIYIYGDERRRDETGWLTILTLTGGLGRLGGIAQPPSTAKTNLKIFDTGTGTPTDS